MDTASFLIFVSIKTYRDVLVRSGWFFQIDAWFLPGYIKMLNSDVMTLGFHGNSKIVDYDG